MTRTWPPVAAVGAGLVHLAVAASAPPLLAVVLAVIGTAEITWAVAVLRAERIVLARTALVVSASSSVAWVATAFTLGAVGLADPAAAVPVLPLLVATAFTLFIAIACARRVRAADAPGAGAGSDERGAWRFIGALASAAVIVGAMATPALAATEAGRHAVPHGEHGISFEVPTGHDH
ncbi:MAG: hypothetical protein ABWX82_10540 [Leifsonia sp.]